MARHCTLLLCVFFLLMENKVVESTASETSPQVLLKPTGRELIESRNVERGFLSSRTTNSEQVNVGLIEDKAVTIGKSGKDTRYGVDDGDSFESESNSVDGRQERNNFDIVLRSFDASVKKLESKLRRKSHILLYSSQETQNNASGVVENKNLNSTVDRPSSVASKVSTKTFELMTGSSVNEKAEFFSTQAISSISSSTAKREILPTPTSSLRIIQQTAGVLKPIESSSTALKAITPSPTISVYTFDENVFSTKTLSVSVSPASKAVTSLGNEGIKPHSSTASSHTATIVPEGKSTADPTLSTKHSPENDTKSVLVITELLSSKPTETSTADAITEVQGKTDGKPGKRGLFRNLSIEILIALVAGALCALLLLAFLVYRLKKRNEGSYDLSETLYMKIRTKDELGMKKEVFV